MIIHKIVCKSGFLDFPHLKSLCNLVLTIHSSFLLVVHFCTSTLHTPLFSSLLLIFLPIAICNLEKPKEEVYMGLGFSQSQSLTWIQSSHSSQK